MTRGKPRPDVEELVHCAGQLDLVDLAAAVEPSPEPSPKKERQ